MAEAQKAILALWLQDTFAGMHWIFFQSRVAYTCWQGCVLACSASHEQLPTRGVYLGN